MLKPNSSYSSTLNKDAVSQFRYQKLEPEEKPKRYQELEPEKKLQLRWQLGSEENPQRKRQSESRREPERNWRPHTAIRDLSSKPSTVAVAGLSSNLPTMAAEEISPEPSVAAKKEISSEPSVAAKRELSSEQPTTKQLHPPASSPPRSDVSSGSDSDSETESFRSIRSVVSSDFTNDDSDEDVREIVECAALLIKNRRLKHNMERHKSTLSHRSRKAAAADDVHLYARRKQRKYYAEIGERIRKLKRQRNEGAGATSD